MKNSEYTLYLDMDGVLVDYSGGWWAIAEQLGIKSNGKEEIRKEDLERVFKQTKNTAFWESLGWEHGGEELWEASNVLFENIHILSSTASKKNPENGKVVEAGKMVWLKEHIPHLKPQNIHIVSDGIEKANFANHMSILVDDRKTTIQAFVKAGGYGILHKASKYRKTIEDLKDVALPLSIGEIARSLVSRRKLWNGK